MAFLKRFLALLPLLILSPILMLAAGCAMALTDLLWNLQRIVAGTHPPAPEPPRERDVPTSATVVIPNWNGRDLLERYLPPLEAAMAGNPNNEILIVDNGSS